MTRLSVNSLSTITNPILPFSIVMRQSQPLTPHFTPPPPNHPTFHSTITPPSPILIRQSLPPTPTPPPPPHPPLTLLSPRSLSSSHPPLHTLLTLLFPHSTPHCTTPPSLTLPPPPYHPPLTLLSTRSLPSSSPSPPGSAVTLTGAVGGSVELASKRREKTVLTLCLETNTPMNFRVY